MYSAVLVPTDGSEGTRQAAEHAIDHADRFDAPLHVLYVVDERLNQTAGTGPAVALDVLEDAGRRAIDRVISQAEAADVDTIEGSVATGSPAQAILDYSDQNDIDLIVMGTHGRTGIDRYLLGSVTEKVVRLSDAPVLTTPLAEN